MVQYKHANMHMNSIHALLMGIAVNEVAWGVSISLVRRNLTLTSWVKDGAA